MNLSNKLSKISNLNSTSNRWISRTLILMFTGVAVFGSMASCSFPNIGGLGAKKENIRYGVLKSDPSYLDPGFAFTNTVRLYDDTLREGALNNQPGIKIFQRDSGVVYLITKDKGLLKTTSQGKEWNRIYVYPVNGDTIVRQDEQILDNDNLKINAISFVNEGDDNKFYLTGTYGTMSKVYLTTDGGKTFKQIYTTKESGEGVYVEQILAEGRGQTDNTVALFLTGGAFIRSKDSGETWSKELSPLPKGTQASPIQAGVLKNNGNKYFLLYATKGLFVSDDGLNFAQQQILEAPLVKSGVVEKPAEPAPGFSGGYSTYENVSGSGQEIGSVASRINQSKSTSDLAYITSGAIFLAPSLEEKPNVLKLPIKPETVVVSDLVIDPKVGPNRMLVAINDQIFETNNKGESWTANDKVKQPNISYGSINQILIDRDDTRKIYLMLTTPPKKSKGLGDILGF
jgi:photosystem II stability/assembly factor-like uncharacterized protein